MNDFENPLYGIEAESLRDKSVDELLSSDFLMNLYDIEDIAERQRIKVLILLVAKEKSVFRELKVVLDAHDKQDALLYDGQFRRADNNTDIDFQDEPLRCGGWFVDNSGVRIQNKTGEMVWASPIPIIPQAIIFNGSSDTEKVLLKFKKPGKRVTSVICERSLTASSSNIVKLANKGIEVTSENAKLLVRYISDVVTKNLDLLPSYNAFSQLGWSEDGFVPYDRDAVFDGEDENRHLFLSIKENGDYDEWYAFTHKRRSNKMIRLTMAASFASVLISLVGALPFVFHLWGGTGTGKTVALKIAMSIWGNPKMGRLVRTMNMTVNSMMSTAAFLNSVPFAGDELQTIKSRWENYDQLIMRITEGIDRGRMNDKGKQGETKTWACSFIFTGEEPCTRSNSGGGVKNRVVEVEVTEPIFTKSQGNEASVLVEKNYGFAGKKFVEYISKIDNLQDRFRDIYNKILESESTTEKQAASMALILLADALSCECIYDSENALTVEDIKDYLADKKEVNVAERAYGFIVNFVAKNQNRFSPPSEMSNFGEVWGKPDRSDDSVLINDLVVKKALSDEGFDFDSIKKKWADKGYLKRSSDGRYSVCTTIYGRSKGRYIKLILPPADTQPDEDEYEYPI